METFLGNLEINVGFIKWRPVQWRPTPDLFLLGASRLVRFWESGHEFLRLKLLSPFWILIECAWAAPPQRALLYFIYYLYKFFMQEFINGTLTLPSLFSFWFHLIIQRESLRDTWTIKRRLRIRKWLCMWPGGSTPTTPYAPWVNS